MSVFLVCAFIFASTSSRSLHAASKQDRHFIPCAQQLNPPKLLRGQSFLLEPGSKEIKISTLLGGHVKPRRCSYKIVRYVRSKSPNEHIVRMEGFRQPLLIRSSHSLLDIDQLNPIVEDRALVKFMSRYPHSTCWVYGNSVEGEGWKPGEQYDMQTDYRPVRIKHALRLWRPESLMISVGGSGMGGNLDSFEYNAEHPVRILLKPTHIRGEFEGAMFAGPMSDAQMYKEMDRMVSPKTYAIYAIHAAEIWDVARKIAPYPPSRDFAGASRKIRRGLKSGDVVPGMTYRQVAWVMGWPNVIGSPEDVLAKHLDAWEYPSSVMSDYADFMNGKFVSYEQFNLP